MIRITAITRTTVTLTDAILTAIVTVLISVGITEAGTAHGVITVGSVRGGMAHIMAAAATMTHTGTIHIMVTIILGMTRIGAIQAGMAHVMTLTTDMFTMAGMTHGT